MLAIIFVSIMLCVFLSMRDSSKSSSSSLQAQQLDQTSSPSVAPPATIGSDKVEPNIGGDPQEDNIFVPTPTPITPEAEDPQETMTSPIAVVSPPTAPPITPTLPPITSASSPIAPVAPPTEHLPTLTAPAVCKPQVSSLLMEEEDWSATVVLL